MVFESLCEEEERKRKKRWKLGCIQPNYIFDKRQNVLRKGHNFWEANLLEQNVLWGVTLARPAKKKKIRKKVTVVTFQHVSPKTPEKRSKWQKLKIKDFMISYLSLYVDYTFKDT